MTHSYDALGASASKAGLHGALTRAGLDANTSLFSAVYPDWCGDSAYRSFLHCDGAGTKSIVAYLAYRETGEATCFAGLAQDALVMNLDDVFAIGTPDKLLLSNLIARNARLIGDDILAVLLSSYRTLRDQFSGLGIPLELSGGETADCGDVVRTLLVDAVLAGRIAVQNLIYADSIQEGDCIVGLSSTGTAKYELKPNSGISSNGLTLARHALLAKSYREQYPEAADLSLDPLISYRGAFRLSDTPPELGMSIGEALLSPTRSYAPILKQLYQTLGSSVHAVIHNTGGGQTKAVRFLSGKRAVKNNLFPVPPLFQLIQRSGQVPWREMFQVFNMGHRMELYLSPDCAENAVQISRAWGVDAQKVGFVEAAPQSKNSAAAAAPAGSGTVLLETAVGSFEYN